MIQTLNRNSNIDKNEFDKLKKWSEYQDTNNIKTEDRYEKLFNDSFILADFDYRDYI